MRRSLKHYSQKIKRDPIYFKAERFKNYLTLKELAVHIERDPSRIRAMEADGRILSPARVKRGQLMIRMYSPMQADEIKHFFQNLEKRGK